MRRWSRIGAVPANKSPPQNHPVAATGVNVVEPPPQLQPSNPSRFIPILPSNRAFIYQPPNPNPTPPSWVLLPPPSWVLASSFEELGLSEEVIAALREMYISVPFEIQCIGIPAILEGKSVVLGSHTGAGKTFAYMLPLIQLLRQDEALNVILMRPRCPRAVVLCPTRELCEQDHERGFLSSLFKPRWVMQVFRVAKSISHHARFRSTMTEKDLN